MGAKRNLDKLRVARYGFYYKAGSARNCARTDLKIVGAGLRWRPNERSRSSLRLAPDPLVSRIPEM